MSTERNNQLIEQVVTRFDQDMDGSMEPEDSGEWVRFECIEKLIELIIKDCVDTLEFHGFEDAVPYIKWMATNKLGVEE